MWTHQRLLFILCTALSSMTCAADVIRVFGYEGRDVKISCSYQKDYKEHEKYLCKDHCRAHDVLITTSQTNKTKYSIYDDRNTEVFTATISDVRVMDAGGYWCGVTRNGPDVYTEVTLEIKPDSCCNEVTKIQSHVEDSVSIRCSYKPEFVNNLKFICRGKQPSSCLQQALVTSTSQNGPIRLTDDRKSSFTVNISSLALEDSGSYLCGVQRNSGYDVFSAVELEVKEWCCVKPKNLKGLLGLSVTFQCPYPPEHRNNRKFICKGNQRHDCKDVMMDQDRFTLLNESSSSFSVTITKLEAGDAGMYWCRSDPEWKPGDYTQVNLSVDAVLYVVLAVSAVLLLLLLMIFVLVKVCKRKVKEPTEVVTHGNRLEAVDAQEEMRAEDTYENDDVFIKRQWDKTSKHPGAGNCYQDGDRDENTSTAEEIYCNDVAYRI